MSKWGDNWIFYITKHLPLEFITYSNIIAAENGITFCIQSLKIFPMIIIILGGY